MDQKMDDLSFLLIHQSYINVCSHISSKESYILVYPLVKNMKRSTRDTIRVSVCYTTMLELQRNYLYTKI